MKRMRGAGKKEIKAAQAALCGRGRFNEMEGFG
jgi:hypothetical protein